MANSSVTIPVTNDVNNHNSNSDAKSLIEIAVKEFQSSLFWTIEQRSQFQFLAVVPEIFAGCQSEIGELIAKNTAKSTEIGQKYETNKDNSDNNNNTHNLISEMKAELQELKESFQSQVSTTLQAYMRKLNIQIMTDKMKAKQLESISSSPAPSTPTLNNTIDNNTQSRPSPVTSTLQLLNRAKSENTYLDNGFLSTSNNRGNEYSTNLLDRPKSFSSTLFNQTSKTNTPINNSRSSSGLGTININSASKEEFGTYSDGDSDNTQTRGKQAKQLQSRRSFTSTQYKILNDWFEDHIIDPYPSSQVKEELAKQCGLTYVIVQNWFINQRMRRWRPLMKVKQDAVDKGIEFDFFAASKIMKKRSESSTTENNEFSENNTLRNNNNNNNSDNNISISSTRADSDNLTNSLTTLISIPRQYSGSIDFSGLLPENKPQSADIQRNTIHYDNNFNNNSNNTISNTSNNNTHKRKRFDNDRTSNKSNSNNNHNNNTDSNEEEIYSLNDKSTSTNRGNSRLPAISAIHLRRWFSDHIANPYPSLEEKFKLCVETKLNLGQVNNFFTNARARFWQPFLRSISIESNINPEEIVANADNNSNENNNNNNNDDSNSTSEITALNKTGLSISERAGLLILASNLTDKDYYTKAFEKHVESKVGY